MIRERTFGRLLLVGVFMALVALPLAASSTQGDPVVDALAEKLTSLARDGRTRPGESLLGFFHTLRDVPDAKVSGDAVRARVEQALGQKLDPGTAPALDGLRSIQKKGDQIEIKFDKGFTVPIYGPKGDLEAQVHVDKEVSLRVQKDGKTFKLDDIEGIVGQQGTSSVKKAALKWIEAEERGEDVHVKAKLGTWPFTATIEQDIPKTLPAPGDLAAEKDAKGHAGGLAPEEETSAEPDGETLAGTQSGRTAQDGRAQQPRRRTEREALADPDDACRNGGNFPGGNDSCAGPGILGRLEREVATPIR